MQHRPLRQILNAVTIAGLLPMAVLLAVMVYRGQLTARQEAVASLQGLTTALASQFELLIANTEAQFQELSSVAQIKTGSRDVCDAWLATNVAGKAGIDAWFRLSPDGKVTCASRTVGRDAQLDATFDPADPNVYNSVHVEPSRVSPTSGKVVFSMSKAYENDGAPYLLVVSLDVGWFYEAVSQLVPLDELRVFLLGDDGEILFVLPGYETPMSGKVPSWDRNIVPDKIPRVITIPIGTDGTERVASNVTMHTMGDGSRLFFTISSTPEALYAKARSFISLGIGTLALAVLGIIVAQHFLFTRLLAKPIESIVAFASSNADDDSAVEVVLPASAPREIVAIGNALSTMTREKDEHAAFLSEALQNLELAQDIARMGYWRIDLIKDELFWSEGVFKLHGLDPKTFKPVVQSAIDLYHPDDRDDVGRALEESQRTKEPFSFEKRVLRSDGSHIYVSARGQVTFNRDGTPATVFGIVIDVDAPKQAQRELKRAQLASEQLAETRAGFLSTVSHEVRAPLAAMLGIVDGFRGQTLSDEHMQQIELLDASGQMLLNVIGDLLDSASSDSGTLRLVETPTDIPHVIETCYRIFKLAYPYPKIEFHYEMTGAPPKDALMDAQRLKQIIFNLLSNAFKHTPEGSVTLKAAFDAKVLTLSVEDTGSGIAPALQYKVFERFSQISSPSNATVSGTGLGLYIVKTIVQTMKGDISVRSEINKGSCFTVRMPLKSGVEDSVPIVQSNDRARVLVVEDNPVNQKLLIAFLRKIKCPYVVHDDGQSALEWLLSCSHNDLPVLALIDVNMPRLNGIELCEFIRTQLPGGDTIPLYLVTADVLADHEDSMKRLAINGCIAKPIDFAALRRVVSTYISSEALAPAA